LQDLLLLSEPTLVVGEVHFRKTLDVGKARGPRDDEVGGFHGSAPRSETPARMRGFASGAKIDSPYSCRFGDLVSLAFGRERNHAARQIVDRVCRNAAAIVFLTWRRERLD
jgi:hypothetical protein